MRYHVSWEFAAHLYLLLLLAVGDWDAAAAWRVVLIADEALVEHQALQKPLWRAGAGDDAVVQGGNHDGPGMQPVHRHDLLNLRMRRQRVSARDRPQQLLATQQAAWLTCFPEAFGTRYHSCTFHDMSTVYSKMSANSCTLVCRQDKYAPSLSQLSRNCSNRRHQPRKWQELLKLPVAEAHVSPQE